jgi:hypothetical protein
MKKTSAPEHLVHPFTKAATGAALLASTAMSSFGVGSAFWDGLANGQIEAWIGLCIIGGALAASEFGAVALAHAITKDGWTFTRGAFFGLATIGNMLACHYGVEAINTRLVAPQRAPYEAAVQSAVARVDAATDGKASLERRHAEEAARLEASFEAERGANPNYVTSRGRQQTEQRDALARRQRAELALAQAAISTAADAAADADAALEQAPEGFSLMQMLGVAILVELFKGALLMAASPRRRRIRLDGNVLPIDPAAYALMTSDELAAIESRASAAKALAQHARRRLKRNAA